MHDTSKIILNTRDDAELVLENLKNIVKQFGSASVQDLCQLVGIEPIHEDALKGWKTVDSVGIKVSVTKGKPSGFMLDLPYPESI